MVVIQSTDVRVYGPTTRRLGVMLQLTRGTYEVLA